MLEIFDLQTEYRTDPIGLDESNPAVSALDRRPDLLAEKACGCLLDRIAGKPVPPETIIPVSLIRRDSTR